MPTLRIMRPDERANHLAAMTIYLNGVLLSTIRNNEIKDFNLPAGKYRLKATMDSQGCKGYSFFLPNEENIELVIATDNKANNPEPLVSGTWLDFVLVPLQLLYYFVIGHNRYLNISELKMK